MQELDSEDNSWKIKIALKIQLTEDFLALKIKNNELTKKATT